MIVIVLFVVAYAAFVVSAVSGGGAGLVLVPLLRTVLPISAVPAALSIGTATSAVSRIVLFRRAIRWDVVRRFLPAALPAAAFGAWLLTQFEPVYVELLLACFLLANLPALFRRGAVEASADPMPHGRLIAIGAAAGLLSGFTGAVGLLFNRAYFRLGMTKDEIVATRATNEVLLHLLKIALYAAFGLLSVPAIAAGALVAVAAILASISMRWLLPLIDEGVFRRVGVAAMVASGAALFAMSSTQIMTMHDAWISYTRPGGEHELQLFWGGSQRLTAEVEHDGTPVLERRVAFGTLPPRIQAAILATASPDEITLIEEVRQPGGHGGYELYFTRGRRPHKVELR